LLLILIVVRYSVKQLFRVRCLISEKRFVPELRIVYPLLAALILDPSSEQLGVLQAGLAERQ